MKTKLALIFILAFPLVSHAESFTGDVYDENKTKQVYTLTVVETPNGQGKHAEATYKTMDGKTVFTELTDTDPGNGGLKSYSIEQPEAKISGKVEVSGKKLLFSYTQDGKTKTDDDDFKPNTLVPSTTTDFILRNWDALLAGKQIDTRFCALDRKETVGFTFFKIGEEQRDGKDLVQIRMKPSSFIIAAVLHKPIVFTLDKATKHNVKIHGRLPIKKVENGSVGDFDGVIVYHYK